MKGKSTTLVPPDNTTREQGIVLIKRTLPIFAEHARSGKIESHHTLQDGKPPAVDDVNKFWDMNDSIQLAFLSMTNDSDFMPTSSGNLQAFLGIIRDLDIKGLVASFGGALFCRISSP